MTRAHRQGLGFCGTLGSPLRSSDQARAARARVRWVLAAWALCAAGCSRHSFVEWPALPGLLSMVIDVGASDPGAARLYGAEATGLSFTSPSEHPHLVAVAFDHDLEALDLPAGAIPTPMAGEGRALSPTLGVYESEDGGPLLPSALTPSFKLPPHDWAAVAKRGRCADGPYYTTAVCGSTVSFEVAEPNPPRLTDEAGQCPRGWSLSPHVIDRGPLGPLTLSLCVPPARVSCSGATLQATSDAACRPTGPSCDPGSPFRPGIAEAPSTVFVLAGAVGGDGSRAAPLGSIQAALRSPGVRVVAVGRGVYLEDVTVTGAIDLVGACAAETVLRGVLALRGHSGQLSGFSLEVPSPRSALDALGSQIELQGVAISGAASFWESEVRMEGSLLAADLLLAVRSTLYIRSSQLSVQLRAESSRISLFDTELGGDPGRASDFVRSTVTIAASHVAVPFSVDQGSLSLSDDWISVYWPPSLAKGTFGGVYRSPLSVARSTFDGRGLPVDPGLGETFRPALQVVTTSSALSVEDVVFLGDLVPKEDRAAGLGLKLTALAQSPRHQVRRVAAQGQRAGAIDVTGADVVLEDIGGYDVGGMVVVAADSALTARRIQGVHCWSGIEVVGSSSASIEDVGFYQGVGHGLSTVTDSELFLLGRRMVFEGDGPEAVRVQQRLGSSQPERIDLRELRVEGHWTAALRALDGSTLTVTDFDFSSVAYGALLGTGQVRLRRGHIGAGLAGISRLDPAADPTELLQGVRIDAPRVFDGP